MMQSEQINELAGALAKAQGAMRNAAMNRINPHFKSKYADLASVLDAIREPLGNNGLAVTQQLSVSGEGVLLLRTTLMHSSGQWLASEYPLPVGTPQQVGSALTYARRYSLAALVCNSADEDDDANAAETATKRPNGRPSGAEVRITKEQVAEIGKMLAAKGRTPEQFCSWQDIGSVADLPADKFETVKSYLTKAQVSK